ncbi:MAG: 23S rRNA (pseudouridine(1915)-N(3))-methyltransferase RlmH [Trueperaceae bacterium]|jgi:23S rRNA (pseudouridine1915-N3)-methyltransferase|nr:23S rRNA (pseudouridine(1915)-N(3))-methyltransferase RlmH [Truepera sp.]HRN19154.1 23S rRNA (pseudouridine(1915)-N(3))-methyltransferase RlmH [Trueperaceae bacterium]HRQ10196.1 23S rRNA (pseudouridine(1915)-N(3))-methyltransferase RlmH [Trueperaceae bacterium]
MRYRVVAVGKLRERFYQDACEHYARRLGQLTGCEVIEVREARLKSVAQAKTAEGESLIAKVQGLGVALDERGTAFDTRALARHLTELENRGTSSVTILVGGAEGHGDALRAAVSEAWSLSPLTLPHELARLVLLEQLYRVETLRAGHPYHRG